MGQLAVWACPIHGGRKLLRQDLRDLIHRNIEARSQLFDGVAAQNLLKLVGGDRQVLTVSQPGLHLLAEACLLQFGDNCISPP